MRWKKQHSIFTAVLVFEVTSIQKLFVTLYLDWSKCDAVQWSFEKFLIILMGYKVVYTNLFRGEDNIYFLN